MEEIIERKPFEVTVGPQHPALKEPGNFQFTVDGEIVTNAAVRLGYAHRGIEKAAEERNWIQNIYLVERICGICSHIHATAYCLAVEHLANIQAPPRAQAIRVLVSELERIHSHLLWIGVAAHEAGFDMLREGPLTLQPFAGVLLAEIMTSSFTEKGAEPYNLRFSGDTYRSRQSNVGARLILRDAVGSRWPYRLEVEASWRHEFANRDIPVNAAFAANPVFGAPMGGVLGLGAAAICALPPLNGLVSEWLVFLGLFDAVSARGPVAWTAVPAAVPVFRPSAFARTMKACAFR